MSDLDPDPSPSAALEIALQNPEDFPEAEYRLLEPWLRTLVSDVAPAGRSIAVRFTGDREMRRLNRQFRGRDTTTDVLSFPGDEGPGCGHIGDIAVSVPTARRQAEEAGHSTPVELRTLLLHGLLHCLGYDHETDSGQMDELERHLRQRWIGSDA